MVLRFGLVLLVAAAVAGLGPRADAQASKGPLWISPAYAPSFYSRFQVCNGTPEALDIAVFGFPERLKPLLQGWTRIGSGGCAALHDSFNYGLFIAARGARSGRTLHLFPGDSPAPACVPFPGSFRITKPMQSHCPSGTREFQFFIPPAADLQFAGIKWAKLTLRGADFSGQTERKVTFVNFSYQTVTHAALVHGNHGISVVTNSLRPGESVTVPMDGFAKNECAATADVITADHRRFHSAPLDTCTFPYLGVLGRVVVGSILPNYFEAPVASAAPPVAATLPPVPAVAATP